VEKAKIKGIVKIFTKQTFLNTVLENKQYLVKETEQFLLKMDSSSTGNRLMSIYYKLDILVIEV
jgi:hypothetical protein